MLHPTWIQRNGTLSLNNFFPQLKSASQIVILTHRSLINIYGSTWLRAFKKIHHTPLILEIPMGESAKSLTQAQRCWNYLSNHQIDRQAAIVAIGGGVVCDLAGFVASHYMRGIASYYIPTSLMAMIDAALGSKTGINACGQKNLIGTFYPPQGVLIDPDYLQTLPKRELYSGMAEVIKYGVIGNQKLLMFLEAYQKDMQDLSNPLWDQLIERCVDIKKTYIEKDPLDQLGHRAFLNYGHTFGHALESMTRYRLYLHGEAVAIGMNCAARLSKIMGLTTSQTADYQEYLLKLYQLPVSPPKLNILRLLQLMKSDKKGVYGKIILILPEKIGKVLKVTDIDPLLIKQVMSEITQN